MSQENLSNSAGPSCLKRSFGMREAVTITAGSVIGVGLFTTGSNVVGNLGIEVIFATLLALLVSIYPALLYAEMGAALPYAGGTYQFASLGLGKAVGVLAGWNFIISLVAVTGGVRRWPLVITSKHFVLLSDGKFHCLMSRWR